MSSIVQHAPRFSDTDAEQIAEDLYGLAVSASPLPSERDQNFHLATANGDAYVLKIANATEALEVLQIQNQAMMHILNRQAETGQNTAICPQVCTTLKGEHITSVEGKDNRTHFVRLLTYLRGKPLARVKPHDRGLLVSFGRFFGQLDRLLEDFDHPAAHRDFHWDLKTADRVVGQYIEAIDDHEKRAVVQRLLSRFQADTEPLLAGLRNGVIHNDGNDYNVLVEPQGFWGQRVSGAIDFGDMLHTCIACEVAIACAYAMLDKADPMEAARYVVAGYHATYPLTESELAVLFDLICMRLCTSVCLSAHQSKLEPDNEYLRISERPAWDLLQKLDGIHPRMGEYTFRYACGFNPVPSAAKIVNWLRDQKSQFGSPVDDDLHTGEIFIFDLSAGSTMIGADVLETNVDAMTNLLFGKMQASSAAVGIGRYNEARLIYTGEQFESGAQEMPKRRTIHLGIDVYKRSGSNIYAPLDGRVHSFGNNRAHLDYGPTIIIEHRTDDGDRFYTLYGHLSVESIDGLETGAAVKKGQTIARIGDSPVNGGWPPHLHFQIITDMFGGGGNFPGVALPSQWGVWSAISPDPNLVLNIPESCFPEGGRKRDKLLSIRREHLGKSLSISYDEPLKIVRASGQYLFSDDGQAYLDGVNNVCHVGHCHPHVVAAGQRQMAVLNTNTRYLHDNIIEYAERLLAKFPDPLNVCFFVCTGSEANELALRMARNYTQRNDIITLEGAYHGNTQALIDISPYKHNGAGGRGAPPWVQTVTMPDPYRGPHKGREAATGVRYAEYVREAAATLLRSGNGPAAFICESMLGCGGQVVLPDGYLPEAYKHVRAAGGVCICDEVQVGFGRPGSHFWAFETQDVVPDIVTLGKPIGNGHPLAAVVTTAEIADAFANGMEYFNTFGGNPVSCAIGMAVLDVIENEGLQENALRAGNRLLKGLTELMPEFSLIGDVRGLGLYAGVELVTDQQTLEPAAEHAAHIINRMKDHGILISTDGPLHNVLKLKPPIVFSEKNADEVVAAVDKIMGEDCLRTQ